MTDPVHDLEERLAAELARTLGIGLATIEVAEDGPAIVVSAVCLFDGRAETVEGRGETRLEAYRDVFRSAARIRLDLAWKGLIAPG